MYASITFLLYCPLSAAKLNQQLVALQTSEVAALQKAESQRLRASSLQGSLLKAERQTEASKREVFTVRRDMNRQLDQLQSTVRVSVL